MSRRAIAISLLALPLAACNEAPATVAALCKVVSSPEFAVRGATAYDQRWVDRTTEALVAGCKQARPKARPPSMDAQPKVVEKKPPPKKPTMWQRLRKTPAPTS